MMAFVETMHFVVPTLAAALALAQRAPGNGLGR